MRGRAEPAIVVVREANRRQNKVGYASVAERQGRSLFARLCQRTTTEANDEQSEQGLVRSLHGRARANPSRPTAFEKYESAESTHERVRIEMGLILVWHVDFVGGLRLA